MESKRLFTIVSSIMLSAVVAAAQGMSVRDTLELGKGNAVAPAQLLSGKVSGVMVNGTDGSLNGDIKTVVRGLNSLRGDSAPLWIVDGTFIDNNICQNMNAFWQESFNEGSYTAPRNTMSFINPYDIGSIQVLKDVSATALYGARGANGVIIINTKRPDNEKFRLKWNSNVGFNTENYRFRSVSHNHYLNGGSSNGRNAYSVSAFFNDGRGLYAGELNRFGGLRANFESFANKTVQFGLGSLIGIGHQESTAATAWWGAPSLTLDKMAGKDISGWLKDYDDETRDYNIAVNAFLNVNITKWLSWKTKVGFNYENNTRYFWFGNGTEMGERMNGAAAILSSSMFGYNGSSELRFHRYFSEKHKLEFGLSVDFSGNKDRFNTMNGSDFFNHSLRARGLSLQGDKALIHKVNRDYSHIAGLAELLYDYSGIVGMNASFRVDNTRRYDDGNVVLYPSANAYVDFRNAFLPDSKAVSALKISGGWGIAGRETVVPCELLGMYQTAGLPVIDNNVAAAFEGFARLRSSEWNAGVELAFLDNRIDISAKYFDKVTEDRFNTYCFAAPSGSAGEWKYTGRTPVTSVTDKLNNRGIEADINALVIKTSNVRWSLNLNATVLSNQVSTLSPCDISGACIGSSLNATVNAIGKSVSSIYGYDLDSDGKPVDHTGDGVVAPEDRIILGSSQPRIFGGFSTTLGVYGFTLDVDTRAVFGNSILNLGRMRMDGADYVSAKYVEKGDYFRLARVSLKYDIPVSRVKWLQELSVNVSGYNLVTATEYSGNNPDVDSFGISNFSRGIDYGCCPTPQTFMLGISVKF